MRRASVAHRGARCRPLHGIILDPAAASYPVGGWPGRGTLAPVA